MGSSSELRIVCQYVAVLSKVGEMVSKGTLLGIAVIANQLAGVADKIRRRSAKPAEMKWVPI